MVFTLPVHDPETLPPEADFLLRSCECCDLQPRAHPLFPSPRHVNRSEGVRDFPEWYTLGATSIGAHISVLTLKGVLTCST